MGCKIVRISRHYFLEMLSTGERHYEVIQDALPPDAEIVNFMVDFPTNDVLIKFFSGEWPHVANGETTPVFLPVLRTIHSDPPKTWRDSGPLL